MGAILGYDGVLKINGTEATNVKDVTLSLETAEADVTTRANDGWRASVATLKEASIEFEMLVDDNDTTYSTLSSAFIDGTSVGVELTVGNSIFSSTCSVTAFSVSQPLEEAQTVSVTLKPTAGETAPSFGSGSGDPEATE